MRSVMKHNFSTVPKAEIQRSVFDRSFGFKSAFNSGYLVPFMVDEIYPGDTFNVHGTFFARLTTPIVPIMDNLFLDTFYFFVPNRLLWDNWEAFNGEQKSPVKTSEIPEYLVPVVKPSGKKGFEYESIFDYMGMPPGVSGIEMNALYARAYNLIYQEWFKDENLIDAPALNTGDGPDYDTDYPLRKRGKRHDYFTSCLPWPQKGPGVELPIGDQAPVYGNGNALAFAGNSSTAHRYLARASSDYGVMGRNDAGDSGHLLYGTPAGFFGGGISSVRPVDFEYTVTDNTMSNVMSNKLYAVGVATKSQSSDSGIYADLSSATAVTINSLRQAFQIQRLYERDARGGTRYAEIIKAHFGVTSPDARLQRPEFLGSSSTRISITPVPQTSETTSNSPQGNLAAYGNIVARDGFTKSFIEHGVLIGIMNVRADLTYQQGIPRIFSRRTRFDYYWPALAHLGEQAVYNKEIYAQGTSADDEVFGYQERYAELRYKPSQITGKMRSTYSQPLDVWHLSQKFNSLPTLNEDFINENVPLERVLAVTDEPQLLIDGYIKMLCARPMPVYSVPGLVDHF